MQNKKPQLEPDTEKRTGSKLVKEYVKAVYCHLAYSFLCCAKAFKFNQVRLFTFVFISITLGCMQVRKQQLELDMEQQTGSK